MAPNECQPQEGATKVSVTRRVPIVLSEYQREQLIRWVSAPGTPARVVRRSRIILQLASGYSVHRASQVLTISEPTIRLWRDRFRFGGLEAITTDAPRPGRPRRARDEARALVGEQLAAIPPGAALSVRALARQTGLGRHLVQQVLLDMGVLPRPGHVDTARGAGTPEDS
jgi:transposase